MKKFRTKIECSNSNKEFDFVCYENDIPIEIGDKYIYFFDGIATAFQIKTIPSILFIPITGTPQMTFGSLSKETLKNAIEEIFGIR